MRGFVAFVLIAPVVLAQGNGTPLTESLGADCWKWVKEAVPTDWKITETSSLSLVQVGLLITKVAKDSKGAVCLEGLQALEDTLCGQFVFEMAPDLTSMQAGKVIVKLANDPKGRACMKYLYMRFPHGIGAAAMSVTALLGSMYFSADCDILYRDSWNLREECRDLKREADGITNRWTIALADGFPCKRLEPLQKEMADYVQKQFPAFIKKADSHFEKLTWNFLGAVSTGVAGGSGLVWGVVVFTPTIGPIVGVVAGAAATIVSTATAIKNKGAQTLTEEAKQDCKKKLTGMREMIEKVKEIMLRKHCT